MLEMCSFMLSFSMPHGMVPWGFPRNKSRTLTETRIFYMDVCEAEESKEMPFMHQRTFLPRKGVPESHVHEAPYATVPWEGAWLAGDRVRRRLVTVYICPF